MERLGGLDVSHEKESGRHPVIIVPGYGSPSFQSNWVGKKLRAWGHDTFTVKLPWLAMGDMVRSAELLSDNVEKVREETGFEKINLLGYSLGGLIARYYLKILEGHLFLGRGAFVASPYAGTYFGYVGFFSPAGRQARPGSPFIRRLFEAPNPDCLGEKCLSIYVRWDGVIVPSGSSYLPGGFNLTSSRPVSHWRAVTSRELLFRASDFLRGGLPEEAFAGRELKLSRAGLPVALAPVSAPAGRRRIWTVLGGPFKSIGRRLASLLRRISP